MSVPYKLPHPKNFDIAASKNGLRQFLGRLMIKIYDKFI
jgi:hypothetical protein